MITEYERADGQEFNALVFAAIRGEEVDLAALQDAADTFLGALGEDGCPDFRHTMRAVGGAAFQMGLLGTFEARAELETAVKAMTMMLKLCLTTHQH